MPSSTVEDYLKSIYAAQEEFGGERVATGRIAAHLGVTPGSVTAMLKTLAESGLVDYIPYAGARLTAAGSRLARRVLRRHRLVELFLVEELGMSWTEVHAEAEQLEHALSDAVLERIDEKLGRPLRDPHGHPIPRAGGGARLAVGLGLLAAPLDTPLRLLRVGDETPAFLRELERLGLMPGARLVIRERNEAAELIRVAVADGPPVELGFGAARKVTVEAVG